MVIPSWHSPVKSGSVSSLNRLLPRVSTSSQVEQIPVGGDGAEWIKKGTEMFPDALFHLDTFHLRRALTRALFFYREHYQVVAKAVSKLD